MQLCAERRALSEAFRFARLVQPPDLKVFNMLLSTCAQAGDADAAFRAFREIGNAGLRADCVAYTTLVSACAKARAVPGPALAGAPLNLPQTIRSPLSPHLPFPLPLSPTSRLARLSALSKCTTTCTASASAPTSSRSAP